MGAIFYTWWAPKNALPLKESGDFSDLPEDSLFLARYPPPPRSFLLWLDISPTDQIVRQSTTFLSGHNAGGIASCVQAALLRSLAEDDLDVEDRVQPYQTDARQYLEVKPEMAWSRTQQAVALLGRAGALTAVARTT